MHITSQQIPKLPWCETPLQAESSVIRTRLTDINRKGFLTINSQPCVNGVSSDHSVFGWGGAGGRVYQKAYVEFFTSPANLRRVLETCSDRLHLDYYAVDAKGQSYSRGSRGTTALTWGVFPNKEVSCIHHISYCMQPMLFYTSNSLSISMITAYCA
jgi:methylenetetrahydrofolate reductase (NADPH)